VSITSGDFRGALAKGADGERPRHMGNLVGEAVGLADCADANVVIDEFASGG
jgi:hypothetical protein